VVRSQSPLTLSLLSPRMSFFLVDFPAGQGPLLWYPLPSSNSYLRNVCPRLLGFIPFIPPFPVSDFPLFFGKRSCFFLSVNLTHSLANGLSRRLFFRARLPLGRGVWYSLSRKKRNELLFLSFSTYFSEYPGSLCARASRRANSTLYRLY